MTVPDDNKNTYGLLLTTGLRDPFIQGIAGLVVIAAATGILITTLGAGRRPIDEDEAITSQRFFNAVKKKGLKAGDWGVVEQDRLVVPVPNNVKDKPIDGKSVEIGLR